MRLHSSVVEKIIKTSDIYSGFRYEERFAIELSKLNLSIYERENGEKILVLTEDLEKHRGL